MGGTPITALNILRYNPDLIKVEIIHQILAGGASVCRKAGVDVLGVYTVKDSELKYGLSVTGRISPLYIIRNQGAQPGDALILTKPLGTGILSTALKKDIIQENDMQEAIDGMQDLNKDAAE